MSLRESESITGAQRITRSKTANVMKEDRFAAVGGMKYQTPRQQHKVSFKLVKELNGLSIELAAMACGFQLKQLFGGDAEFHKRARYGRPTSL